MDALHLRARAKINLYLGVGQILASGYHRITTLIQSITLADQLIIEPADDLFFTCDDPSLSGPDNLAYRAAAVLRDRFQVRSGAKISLHKRIPAGAGLGGGSADAAAALIGLAELWNLRIDLPELVELAAELGADVAFCLYGGTALATGFGEEIRPLPALDLGTFLIAKPVDSLPTRLVYGEYDALPVKPATSPDAMIAAVEAGDRDRVIDCLANDLEPAAERLAPAVRQLKASALRAGAKAAMVSGSGSAVMIFPSPGAPPERIAESLAGQPVELFVVQCATGGTDVI